ncbi:hypothetical protein Fmac_027107 [Flemingia macrophylla]|uniref:Uncharacterized protein n=1 Tax=Flemingia macrophylla TaxID=520843 RepID=A0ABD1LH96_9FABA
MPLEPFLNISTIRPFDTEKYLTPKIRMTKKCIVEPLKASKDDLLVRGIDALPGMTILSTCLETVSGAGQGCSTPEDINSVVASEASWERPPVTWKPTERTYAFI